MEKKMKNSEDNKFKRKFKSQMDIDDWNKFQKSLEDQSKWDPIYERLEQVSKTINKEIVIWEEDNILGFHYKNLDQGVDLVFYLRLKDFILVCVVLDEGEIIDYYESSYKKKYDGDIKFINEILTKYT